MIEMLTVIAIIALLAAILFPVFAAVRKSVKETQCLSNLHQISQALQLYKDNNGTYPTALDTVVLGNGTIYHYLSGQYVKSDAVFHCPVSPYPPVDSGVTAFNSNQLVPPAQLVKRFPVSPPTGAAVTLCDNGARWRISSAGCATGETAVPYTYPLRDSYDAQFYPPQLSSKCEIHYAGDWTETGASISDNPRQLKYRNPPSDTVVTWCMYHTNPNNQGIPHGMVMVLFKDGTAKKIPGPKFVQWALDGNTWQVHP